MLLCRYHLIGALTLIHLTHTFVLLTANIDDVKKIARKFVPEPLAQQIADFIAKASSNTARDVSEENEQNAEDIKQLSESEQQTYKEAARQGKQNYVPKKTTLSTSQPQEIVSIERTTQAIKSKPRKKVVAKQWHGMKVIPLGRDNKKNLNQEHRNILRELKPKRLEKKQQYWQQQKKREMEKAQVQAVREEWQKNKDMAKAQLLADREEWQKNKEMAKAQLQTVREDWQKKKDIAKAKVQADREEWQKNKMEKAQADGEDWQKGEKNWRDRHSRDQDWLERLKLTTERYIFNPKMEDKEAEPQEEKLKGKRQKWSKVKTKSENSRPQFESKTIFENEHEEINPADYDPQTTESDLTIKDQAFSDYIATPDVFERVKERRIRQREAKKNRERFAFQNFEPKANETEDSTPKINGFNIENELTTEKERNEFDQYDNLKYKDQFYPRSQLVATSGNVMLAKLQDTKPAKMPTEPLELPKVEPQGWWDNDKEKAEEEVQ